MSLLDIARELSRFRNLRQVDKVEKDIRSCYADALLMDYYGMKPGATDLQPDKNGYAFLPRDLSKRSVKMVMRDAYPMRVYKRFLGHDIYVFVRSARDYEGFKVVGWLSGAEVYESPILSFPNGDFCHEIEMENLIKMPDVFDFTEQCQNGFGMWNYDLRGWECFGCGRIELDGKTRDDVQRESVGGSDPMETHPPEDIS